jgi:hypothetical protein
MVVFSSFAKPFTPRQDVKPWMAVRKSGGNKMKAVAHAALMSQVAPARRANQSGVLIRAQKSIACRENFSLSPSGKSILELRPSRALTRGAYRDRHDALARDAMDVAGVRHFECRTKHWPHTAKPRGPDASTLASTRR